MSVTAGAASRHGLAELFGRRDEERRNEIEERQKAADGASTQHDDDAST